MSGVTTNYALIKPTVGGSENEWGGNLNDDLDEIDALLGGDRPINGIDIDSGTIDGGAINGIIGGTPEEGEDPVEIHPDVVLNGKVKVLIGLDDPDGIITNCDVETRNLTIVNGCKETQHTIGAGNNIDVLGSKSSIQYMPVVDPAQTIGLTLEEGHSVTLVLNWTDPTNPPAISWETPAGTSLMWVGGGSPNINEGKNVIQFWCMNFGTGKVVCGAYTGVVS